ncbi:plasmid pRiA4b ORF-3 family protein [Metabacillus litoralis]|uniref:plasmid pRiA4b ORF-3 family protein n=1 Tax=Metabacillus litoralis TaxID=152268 RepID=UPI001CFD931F|nr:plasmid pRiA4b ORF-3 family protein [Metabacillus litoralis]
MLIQCTKKLLTELKVKPALTSEENALFSWHANFLTINRRKTLVLMNDSNRYIIVLHGLKAAHIKKIDQFILQSIEETFRDEGVKDDVIEQYISQAKEVAFTTTKDRTHVARLNKACEAVAAFESELNLDKINQSALNKWVSRLIVGNGKNDYSSPNEDLYADLSNLVGNRIFSPEALILHVKLILENRHIWRRIVVPKNITFTDLHKTLQIVFGWQDCHLHEFTIYKAKPKDIDKMKHNDDNLMPVTKIVSHEEAFELESSVPVKFETGEKLVDYLPAEIEYTYDFGDVWQHSIVVEQMIDNYDVNHPTCLAGEGNAPPEDVGGEPGYEEFLKIIADPTHPEFRYIKQWGISQGYEDFDMEMINFKLS